MMEKQNVTQRHSMIQAFLQSKQGMQFDPCQAREAMRSEWGIDYDWHPFADVLDWMSRIDEAVRVKTPHYMTTYRIGYCGSKGESR